MLTNWVSSLPPESSTRPPSAMYVSPNVVSVAPLWISTVI
jgi:hypothetical protein